MEGALDKSYQLVTKLSAHLGSHQLRPLGCGLIFHDPRLCSVGFLRSLLCTQPKQHGKAREASGCEFRGSPGDSHASARSLDLMQGKDSLHL